MHIRQTTTTTTTEKLNEQQCSHEHEPVNRPTRKIKQLREKAVMEKKVTQSATHSLLLHIERNISKQANKQNNSNDHTSTTKPAITMTAMPTRLCRKN